MIRRIVQLIVVSCAILALAGAVWWGYQRWRPSPPAVTQPSVQPNDEAGTPSNKIIVGDQAQKNLGLTAKRLQTGVFWKTISIQGMVVDRPGFSDREVVAPAVGTVSQLFHVPGDMVRPGDKLFMLKLASESLQQTQTELFKTSKDIKLAEARRERLVAGGNAIAQARVIEVENEISRLEVTAQGYRQELFNRGISLADVNGVADGRLLSEITLVVPPRASAPAHDGASLVSASTPTDERPLAYELQELKVELGEQVQAGQTLCHLSNHQSLAIEGRAFRDETSLLERSVQEGWPVEVDFQEDAGADWPTIDQAFHIRYIANIDRPGHADLRVPDALGKSIQNRRTCRQNTAALEISAWAEGSCCASGSRSWTMSSCCRPTRLCWKVRKPSCSLRTSIRSSERAFMSCFATATEWSWPMTVRCRRT